MAQPTQLLLNFLISHCLKMGSLDPPKVPGYGLIGHELAILNFLARKVPVLAGQDDAECAVSFQIVQAAEDIYLKLTKYQNTMGIKDKCA